MLKVGVLAGTQVNISIQLLDPPKNNVFYIFHSSHKHAHIACEVINSIFC